jgi:RNA-binding protein YhbY
MTTSERTDLTPKGLHDTLVRRVLNAMRATRAVDLTIEELQTIAAVIEPAVGREQVDLIGNVVQLASAGKNKRSAKIRLGTDPNRAS